MFIKEQKVVYRSYTNVFQTFSVSTTFRLDRVWLFEPYCDCDVHVYGYRSDSNPFAIAEFLVM